MLIRLAVRSFNTRITVMGKQLTAENPSMEISSTALLNTLQVSGSNTTSDIEDLKTYLSRGLIEIFEGSKQIRTLDEFDALVNEGPATALLSTEFVLRPNDPAGAHDNVYLDWETLYADAQGVTAPKRIFFDFQYTTRVIIIFPPFDPLRDPIGKVPRLVDLEDPSIRLPPAPGGEPRLPPLPPRRRYVSDIVLPAGNWDLGMNTELIGSSPLSVPNPKLVFADGCVLTGVNKITDLPMYTASTQPVFQPTIFTPSNSYLLRMFGYSFLDFESGASTPAIQWSHASTLAIDLFDYAALGGPGMVEALSGSVNVSLFDASYIAPDAVLLSGGAGAVSMCSTGAARGNPQTGMSISNVGDPAYLMFYASSGSPDDWATMPVDILEAVNRLASAVAALRGTPIP